MICFPRGPKFVRVPMQVHRLHCRCIGPDRIRGPRLWTAVASDLRVVPPYRYSTFESIWLRPEEYCKLAWNSSSKRATLLVLVFFIFPNHSCGRVGDLRIGCKNGQRKYGYINTSAHVIPLRGRVTTSTNGLTSVRD
jgi:hypothetical protein